MITTLRDGFAIVEDAHRFEKIDLDSRVFGRLTFAMETARLTVQDANALIDELDDLDDVVQVYVDDEDVLEFDYCVTSDMLPVIRGIIDPYLSQGAALTLWIFDDIIQTV